MMTGQTKLTAMMSVDKLKQLLGEFGIGPEEVLSQAQAKLLAPVLEPFEQLLQQQPLDTANET